MQVDDDPAEEIGFIIFLCLATTKRIKKYISSPKKRDASSISYMPSFRHYFPPFHCDIMMQV